MNTKNMNVLCQLLTKTKCITKLKTKINLKSQVTPKLYLIHNSKGTKVNDEEDQVGGEQEEMASELDV